MNPNPMVLSFNPDVIFVRRLSEEDSLGSFNGTRESAFATIPTDMHDPEVERKAHLRAAEVAHQWNECAGYDCPLLRCPICEPD